MIPILISIAVGGVLASGIVLFTLKGLKTKAAAGEGADFIDDEKKSKALDEEIDRALEYLNTMLPLAGALEKEQNLGNIRNDLAAETKKLKDLDAQLSRLQGMVESAEASHNELKKGREDCENIAQDLKDKKDQLVVEAKKLESELNQSKAQLTMLSGEVSMTKEQKAALGSIMAAIDNSQKQLQSLNEVYTVASTRFINLEAQYSELEKEFTKLVEKELSGKS